MTSFNHHKAPYALILLGVLGLQQQVLAADAGGMPMKHDNMPMHEKAEKISHGVGVVKEMDKAAGTVTLSHEPIVELGWPAMTMPFKVAGNAANGISIGQKVQFDLKGEGNDIAITKLQAISE